MQTNMRYVQCTTFAYQVSGEYAMISNGIKNGTFDKNQILIETISCLKGLVAMEF